MGKVIGYAVYNKRTGRAFVDPFGFPFNETEYAVEQVRNDKTEVVVALVEVPKPAKKKKARK